MGSGWTGVGVGNVPGAWTLLESGVTVLADNSGETQLSQDYTVASGETIVAFVGSSGSDIVYVHNDNTSQNPGTLDVHWNTHCDGAGNMRLLARTGSNGGCTLHWLLYRLGPTA